MGGFYLMGENVPPEMIARIHQWLIDFTRDNFTPYRLERHYVDVRYRRYRDEQTRQHREELTMHVPITVHTPI
jgi:hypothetical protein